MVSNFVWIWEYGIEVSAHIWSKKSENGALKKIWRVLLYLCYLSHKVALLSAKREALSVWFLPWRRVRAQWVSACFLSCVGCCWRRPLLLSSPSILKWSVQLRGWESLGSQQSVLRTHQRGIDPTTVLWTSSRCLFTSQWGHLTCGSPNWSIDTPNPPHTLCTQNPIATTLHMALWAWGASIYIQPVSTCRKPA